MMAMDSRHAVAAALVAYGNGQRSREREAGPWRPTADEEVNELVRDNPLAFLLALIFNRQIDADDAWRAPLRLRERLGHLDARRLAEEEASVEAAVAEYPALHRFVHETAHNVSAAARRVLRDYKGDAGRIWADGPSAAVLHRRFEQFRGLGQKTAAVGVANVALWMGHRVEQMEGADIAYDIHVRRVFLRSRLAEVDDQRHMLAVARELSPAHPGELDYGAWLIGKTVCRPRVPDCPRCPITEVCPKDLRRATHVRGA